MDTEAPPVESQPAESTPSEPGDTGVPAIQLMDVTKLYDARPAVQDFSLDVPRGSLFGLIGPNGSGKTTTLKMISTLIKPDRGRLRVCGYDLDRGAVREVRRLIGYMPDQFGVFRGLNCVEYLQFFGRIFGLHGEELEARISDVFSLTDLDPVKEQLTTALSTGVRQRLSLAKTLLHDPEVLVLDEPASGLDPRARIEIRSLLKELGRMGKTIIISSHILRDLEEICTDVAIIEEGRHIWSGPLKAVRTGGDARVDAILEVPVGDVERAKALVDAHESVSSTTDKGEGRIEAIMAAGSGNDVLGLLIREGIEIVSYTQEPVDLEALFLERTKGIIS